MDLQDITAKAGRAVSKEGTIAINLTTNRLSFLGYLAGISLPLPVTSNLQDSSKARLLYNSDDMSQAAKELGENLATAQILSDFRFNISPQVILNKTIHPTYRSPTFSGAGTGKVIISDIAEFKRAISFCLHAHKVREDTDLDDLLFIDIADTRMTLFGTNRFALGHCSFSCAADSGLLERQLILPGKILNRVLRVFPEEKEISLSVFPDKITIQNSDGLIAFVTRKSTTWLDPAPIVERVRKYKCALSKDTVDTLKLKGTDITKSSTLELSISDQSKINISVYGNRGNLLSLQKLQSSGNLEDAQIKLRSKTFLSAIGTKNMRFHIRYQGEYCPEVAAICGNYMFVQATQLGE